MSAWANKGTEARLHYSPGNNQEPDPARDCGEGRAIEGRLQVCPLAVVRRDEQTTKVCMVYYASTRTTGPSLNDYLHVSPRLNVKSFDILLRFRVHHIAITDIKKTFLMISVAKKD